MLKNLANTSNYLVVDIETQSKGEDFRVFNADNFLVSIGWIYQGQEYYIPVQHYTEPFTNEPLMLLRKHLKECELVIGHNLKFDLTWLESCSIYVERKPMWDTQIMEYILARGAKYSFKLDELAKKYFNESKKEVDYSNIYGTIWEELKEYGLQDLRLTEKLFKHQVERMN